LKLSDFAITTDNSIWPFKDLQKTTGVMLDGTFFYRSQQSTASSGYFRCFIKKSTQKYSYYREVQKIGTVVSYVGGLFGMFYSFLAFLSLYNEKYYKVELIKNIFNLTKESKVGCFLESFNFFKFVYMKCL
jgi:hypothetical protein